MKKNKASAVVIAIIIVVVLAIIGGGVWYVVSKNQPSSSPTGEEDQYKDWKTYRNEEYGFEFRYPKEWPQPTMTGGCLSGGFPQEKSKWTLRVGIIGKGPCEGADCSQYELSGFSYLDYDSALNSLQENDYISEPKETKLNSLEVITYIESGLRLDQTALIFGPTQTLKFVNVWGEEKYFNQILSTFKFTK
jgi:hypothetical protein